MPLHVSPFSLQLRGSCRQQVCVAGKLHRGSAATGTAMEFSELIKTATVESVLLSCAGLPAVKGTLCITSHHLLLSSCPGGDAQPGTVELWLLIRNVDAVEKRWVSPRGQLCAPFQQCHPCCSLRTFPAAVTVPVAERGHPTALPQPSSAPRLAAGMLAALGVDLLFSSMPQSAEFRLVPTPWD